MKKRILSIVLAIAMVAMLLPAMSVSAAAAIPWPEVGGNVTIGGKEYVYVGDMGDEIDEIWLDESYLASAGSYPFAGGFGEGYFTWDAVDTLTLNNTTGTFEELYTIIGAEEISLNIVFEGKNVWNVSNKILYENSEEPYYRDFYLFDLYASYGENEAINSYTIRGPGSLEINAEGKGDGDGILCDAPLTIEDVTLDFDLSVAWGVGIDAYDRLTVKNADISVNVTLSGNTENGYDDAAAIYSSYDMTIEGSRITGKIEDKGEYAEGQSPYLDFICSYETLRIDNSIIAAETVSAGEAYVVYASDLLEIKNGSALEVKGTGSENFVVSSARIVVEDSYVKATTNTGFTVSGHVVTTEGEEGEADLQPLTVKDAVILSPGNAVIGTYTVEGDDSPPMTILVGEEPALDVMIVPEKFPDVGAADWFVSAVGFANARGIFIGMENGNFAPDTALTRAEMMTVLARMAGVDVAPEAGEEWYADAVAWAMAEGISDGTEPNAPITREQMVTMIWRFYGEPASEGSYASFPDAGEVHDWAAKAVAWAVENGVIRGHANGNLAPRGTTTRAEVAQVFKNILIGY